MAVLAAIPAAIAAAAPYLTAASMVIGAASAGMSYMAANEQAAAQKKANQATAENALRARNFQVQQLQTRALQESDAASERIFESRLQALEGSASALNIAGARGIQGGTVEALAREYWAKQGRQEEAITRTANNTIQQLAAEQQGVQAQYENRMNSIQPVREPSLWSLGLGIGSALANAGSTYTRSETKNPSPRLS